MSPRGLNVDIVQIARRLAEAGIDFEHHAVLVQLGEHDRNLTLAEGVVQRVVDQLRRHAQPRRRVPVDDHLKLPSLVLLVAGDVPKLGKRLELLDEPRSPDVQFFGAGILEAVLELRAAYASFDRQVLHGLHEQADAGDLFQRRLQPADDGAGVDPALVERLEVDLDATRIQRRVGAVDADERRQACDRRVLEDRAGQRLLPRRHRREGDVLRRFGNAHNDSRVLDREESLGRDDVEIDCPDERGDGDEQGQRLVPQHDRQCFSIEIDHRLEGPLRSPVEPALLGLGLVLQ